MAKRFIYNLILDIIYIACGIWLTSLFVSGSQRTYLLSTYKVWFVFVLVMLLVSFFYNKYELRKKEEYYPLMLKFFKSWGTSVIIVVFLLYILNLFAEHRFMLLMTFVVILIMQHTLSSLVFFFRNAIYIEEKMEKEHLRTIQSAIKSASSAYPAHQPEENGSSELFNRLSEEISTDVLQFIKKHAHISSDACLFISTTDRFNVLQYHDGAFDTIVNIANANDLRRINKFFESICIKLKFNGIYIQCVEALIQRKKRYMRTFPPVIAQIFYLFDFIIHRVWPRMPYIRKSYFLFFKGKNQRLSYAETLGRLYSCGFEHVAECEIEDKLWFAVRKTNLPALSYKVTYGPIVKLKRIGKNGNIIYVYKFRTMHPYSEYLQSYIYSMNKLAKGGKFKNDFRVSTVGKVFRKLWLDELPMLVNMFKGQLKLVGVRPLSEQYFNLYPEEYKSRRLRYKPGLIPPYYVHLPGSLEEIIESEIKYLDYYDKYGFWADVSYFFRALWNIIRGKAKTA